MLGFLRVLPDLCPSWRARQLGKPTWVGIAHWLENEYDQVAAKGHPTV